MTYYNKSKFSNSSRKPRYSGGYSSSSGYSNRRRGGGYRSSSYRRGGGRFNRNRFRVSTQTDERLYIKRVEYTQEFEEYVPKYKFVDFNIDPVLKENISQKGYNMPLPIQDQAIPYILEGKDLLGIANTGTGKTAAFLIPLIQKVIKNRNSKIIIITPTRELADQITDELFILNRYLSIFSVKCIGGTSIINQIKNLRRNHNFIIGTPGRLLDLIKRKELNISNFSTVVLDEVDRMLDMGFIEDIRSIIKLLPKERQSLFFSATVDPKIEGIIRLILKPGYIKISVKTGETSKLVNQEVVHYSGFSEKLSKLEILLKSEKCEKVLVFVNRKYEVDKLDKHLYTRGFQVDSIHGDKRQSQRQRAILNFKRGKSKVLIATDVAARGLDISGVTHVINYDPPNNYQDYIHRIGRTGRVDKFGTALTFIEKRYDYKI